MKIFGEKTFEFGERVLAEPKRKIRQLRQKTLDAKFREATWVGYSGRTAEHVVTLPEGGPAIKVRTAKSRPSSERWNAEAIKCVIARPDAPNPKDPNQTDPRSERETLGLDFGAKGGQDLPKQHVQPEEEMKRDFRITERLLIEYGCTVGCKGCEAKLKGSSVKPYSISCRRRLGETMRAAGRDEEVLNRRDARMRLREREQRHSHRGGDETPESSPEDVPVEEEAEPTKRKAEETTRREQDVESQPSKKQRLETVTCEGDVGESLMQAIERVLNQCSPNVRYGLPARATGDCTHQDVTSAINVLTEADPHAKDELYQDFEFIDDVSGRVLDHELAVKARKLEMDFFRKMRVYDKVPRDAATRDGCRVTSTMWVDINKRD